MSNTIYNTHQYVKFTADEFLSLLLTSIVAAFIFSTRDLLFERFGDIAAIQQLLFLFLFLTIVMLVTIWLCKIIAIRIGYTITYNAHYLGLALGVVIAFASAGFLPLFLPGGFSYHQPQRLAIGKFRGTYKGWELGLIAGSFPLIMIAWVLLLSPIYILTKGVLFLHAMTAVILMGLYACIPAPGIMLHHSGLNKDWFRYLRGTTFGLEIAYISRYWWMALCFTVLMFWGLTYLLTALDQPVIIFVYIFAMLLGAFTLWIYHLFFKQLGK